MSHLSFSELGVPAAIVSSLTRAGIDTPFPIQVDTLPDTLAGRDVLGRGKTGSGKTLAFSIPMVARLAGELAGGRRGTGRPLGLVLAPTRELATQITNVMRPLAEAMNLRVTTIFGGVSQTRQVQALRDGVEIVVATPGRVEDLMAQGYLRLDAIEITVLDEADHMADLGFLPGVTRILAATPQGGQRLLFSATLDNGVNKLVDRFLNNQVLHSVDDANSPVEQMTHHVFETADADTKKKLVYTLASGTGRRILFMRTKHHAKKLAKASQPLESPQWTCTGTCPSPRVIATWPPSWKAPSRFLSPLTSQHAECTSITSTWSSTSIPRWNTRHTSTAPGEPLVPVRRGMSSLCVCPPREKISQTS